MEGPRPHLHVIGLQDDAALLGPESVKPQDKFWKAGRFARATADHYSGDSAGVCVRRTIPAHLPPIKRRNPELSPSERTVGLTAGARPGGHVGAADPAGGHDFRLLGGTGRPRCLALAVE